MLNKLTSADGLNYGKWELLTNGSPNAVTHHDMTIGRKREREKERKREKKREKERKIERKRKKGKRKKK